MSHSIRDFGTNSRFTQDSTVGPTLRDVRPILERSPDSIWARAEQARDAISDIFRQSSKKEGFDALVLKSPPSVQPAWVKLECWIPKNPERGRAVTERGSALVTIVAKEFHRYELEYTVELHDREWSKTYRRLRRLDPAHLAQIVNFILVRGPKPKLANLQLRLFTPLQIWKPANKVDVLRMDWVKVIPVAMIILGLAFASLLPLALIFLVGSAFAYYFLDQRRGVVLSPGKPVTEPRNFSLMDSWQAVISGLGPDAELLRDRLFAVLRDPPMTGLHSRVETLWDWGLDGIVEREQVVLTFRRAILFCQIYEYDQELYVGWDAHLNHGQWVEKTVRTGIHKQSGDLTRVNTVVSGWQRLTEYDVTDGNCLIEWMHAKLVQLVKRLMEERKIDQEIDFKILRGERQDLTTSQQAGDRIQQAARRATRNVVRIG
jgi:hypothetical protein